MVQFVMLVEIQLMKFLLSLVFSIKEKCAIRSQSHTSTCTLSVLDSIIMFNVSQFCRMIEQQVFRNC